MKTMTVGNSSSSHHFLTRSISANESRSAVTLFLFVMIIGTLGVSPSKTWASPVRFEFTGGFSYMRGQFTGDIPQTLSGTLLMDLERLEPIGGSVVGLLPPASIEVFDGSQRFFASEPIPTSSGEAGLTYFSTGLSLWITGTSESADGGNQRARMILRPVSRDPVTETELLQINEGVLEIFINNQILLGYPLSSITAQIVPEPTSIAFCISLIGLALTRRSNIRKKTTCALSANVIRSSNQASTA